MEVGNDMDSASTKSNMLMATIGPKPFIHCDDNILSTLTVQDGLVSLQAAIENLNALTY
jgi:hypothetical protein